MGTDRTLNFEDARDTGPNAGKRLATGSLRLPALAAACLLLAAASAGALTAVVTEYAATDSASGTSRCVSCVSDEMMQADCFGTAVTIRLDRALMWMTDHPTRSYTEMTFGQVDAMWGQVNETLSKLSRKKRAKIEKMMRESFGQTLGVSEPDYAPTGRKNTVAGQPCIEYALAVGTHTSMRAWITKRLKLLPQETAFSRGLLEKTAAFQQNPVTGILRAGQRLIEQSNGVVIEDVTASKTAQGEHILTRTLVSRGVKDVPRRTFYEPRWYSNARVPQAALPTEEGSGPDDDRVDEPWLSALAENTSQAYGAYLKAYPLGAHADQAHAWIEEPDEAFLNTCRLTNARRIEGFIKSHPESGWIPLARLYQDFCKAHVVDSKEGYEAVDITSEGRKISASLTEGSRLLLPDAAGDATLVAAHPGIRVAAALQGASMGGYEQVYTNAQGKVISIRLTGITFWPGADEDGNAPPATDTAAKTASISIFPDPGHLPPSRCDELLQKLRSFMLPGSGKP